MGRFEWRKFNFFDLKSEVDQQKVRDAIEVDAQITSATCGNNYIILCDSAGYIHAFTKTWESISFVGHDGAVSLCELSTLNNLLVTIGMEENETVPLFKVWNLSKMTSIGAPCIRTVKTSLAKPTALALSDNGQCMAIGFDRGSISLYRGDIGRDRSKLSKELSAGTSKITGIAFNNYGKVLHMFVCSDMGVLVYQIHGKDKEIRIKLDTTTVPTRCCSIQRTQSSIESSFMVGRDDAVYCYTSDGKGPCYALEGEKSVIRWFRSHLLAVSKPPKNMEPSSRNSPLILTVIDVQNKFIVFTTPIDDVALITIEFGTCFIVTRNKNVYQLDEKDIQSKLNMLFKKNLYDIAVRIAKNNQYDTEELADIFRQYGDHLYNKGDFTGAIEQYSKTIGYLEPSYVIRRFLDSRHILCLTDYLQAIHRQGMATTDHTTLLLNCFTRLERTDQLKEFLKNDHNPDVRFDLDVAITVCRNASIEDALKLARRNNKHEFVLSILAEDLLLYDDALEYISNLSYSDGMNCLKRYGYILMKNSPSKTTEVLKTICVLKNQKIVVDNDLNLDIDLNVENSSAEDFFHLFIDFPDYLIQFLEHLVEKLSKCSQRIYNTLIETYLQQWSTVGETDLRQKFEDNLLKIMKEYDNFYDKNHALILCRNYEFWPGVMLIYEEQKHYHLIVRYHLKNRDYNHLISTCKRLGTNQPSLWLQALTGLRQDKHAPPNLVSKILQVIAQEKLQAPLQVLNCLAVENGPTLFSVREYFVQVFQKEKDDIKNEEELVDKYRKDSSELKAKIRDFKENRIEFRGSICDFCRQPLTHPSIYFLCQHAFHQDCLRGYSENEQDCSVCQSKNVQIKNALRAQTESRGQHEIFHNQLDRSTEPFSVVAEYFGRGLFNKIMLFNDDTCVDDNTELIRPTVSKPSALNTEASSNRILFGPGAEGKMRTEEINSKIFPVPLPEGRMRLQENRNSKSNYSSSLEANLSHSVKKATTSKTSNSNQSDSILKSVSKSTKSGANPFDDDDDSVSYDESKNPFADDDEQHIDTSKYDDYDNNLNPFAE